MRKKFLYGCSVAVIAAALSGCAAVLLAGAGAGGTFLWQEGKLVSEEIGSVERGAAAVKNVFKENKIKITNEVARQSVVQLRGEYPDTSKVAADIIRTSDKTIRFEIRVGVGSKKKARQLLAEIKRIM
ncbi:MAG: DUF3568 domain-containing protein [Candidatus Omnitrophica bacterium]|nr:DUF3568 domain-containing protein [Candidatus Omnitrophota bacterium]